MHIEVETTINLKEMADLIDSVFAGHNRTINQTRRRQIGGDTVFNYKIVISTHWTDTRNVTQQLLRSLANIGVPYLVFGGRDVYMGLYDLFGNYTRATKKSVDVSPARWGKQTMMYRNFKAMKLIGAV